MMTASPARTGYLTKITAGTYEALGRDGQRYQVTRDYGVGFTFRGWSAFRHVDGKGWVATAWSGDTLREVTRQMVLAEVLWLPRSLGGSS